MTPNAHTTKSTNGQYQPATAARKTSNGWVTVRVAPAPRPSFIARLWAWLTEE